MRIVLAGPIAEDVELLVRPDRDPAAQVVLPTADPGDALGFDETAAALLGRGLGTLADDHAGQHVGDCAQMSDLLLGTMADRPIEDEDPRHPAARHAGKRVEPVRPRAPQPDL